MILLATRVALQLLPACWSSGGQPEQDISALHTGILPNFGVRTLADGEGAFHGPPQLMDNAGGH